MSNIEQTPRNYGVRRVKRINRRCSNVKKVKKINKYYTLATDNAAAMMFRLLWRLFTADDDDAMSIEYFRIH